MACCGSFEAQSAASAAAVSSRSPQALSQEKRHLFGWILAWSFRAIIFSDPLENNTFGVSKSVVWAECPMYFPFHEQLGSILSRPWKSGHLAIAQNIPNPLTTIVFYKCSFLGHPMAWSHTYLNGSIWTRFQQLGPERHFAWHWYRRGCPHANPPPVRGLIPVTQGILFHPLIDQLSINILN